MSDKTLENRILDLTVTDVTNEGCGVSRYEGCVVMVPGAVRGDVCDVKITKVGKSCMYGELVSVRVPGSERIDPECGCFGECGGCAFQSITYEEELRLKEQWVRDSIRRIGKIDGEVLPVIPSKTTSGYRNKAIYQAGKNSKGKTVLGFYKAKTHEVVDARNCVLQPEEFGRIIEAVCFFCDENRVSVYDEKTGRGLLRALYIRKAFATGETGITVVINGDSFPGSGLFCDFLKKQFSDIVSIVLNINKKSTNVVLGNAYRTLSGKDHITDILCGKRIDISPKSFYQVNHDTAETLYGVVKEYADIKDGESLVDLYCGAGTIGLSAIGNEGRLIGVEIVDSAVENAKMNAAQNGMDNAEFICADAGKAAERLLEKGTKPDAVIVDPPRKGCDEVTLEAIVKMSPQRMVYVSCNHATLARDIGFLAGKGYVAEKIQPVDMFPRTCHVECVCLLSNRDGKCLHRK